MKLTEEQMNKALETIRKRWTSPQHCNVCGKSDWGVDDTIYQLSEYRPDKVQPTFKVKPLVTLICNNCGHTITMNAIHLGVVEPQKGATP